MRVLVTGGAGFIGSHIVERLGAAGHEVTVIDNLSSGKTQNLDPAIRILTLDLGDREALGRAVREEKPETIVHLAAQKSVSASVDDPIMDARENILGSLNLFESAREAGVKRIVFASTGGALYGDTAQLPTPETHETRPESPYGVAKLAIEHYLRFYRQVHGIHSVVLRMANVYGPRQDPHGEAGVVAIFCSRAVADQGIVIYGDGLQSRDYTYVKDAADAFIKAVSLDRSVTVNIGTGTETTVIGMVEGIELVTGRRLARHHEPARAGEIRRSCLDNASAKLELGWQPQYGLGQGLAETVRFFRAQG